MYNLLIIDDNLIYSKNLVNFLLKQMSNIKLSAIATDGTEALNYLTSGEYNFDIILLDLKLPNCTGIDLIKKIKGLNKYNNSIIVISGENEMLASIINEDYIFSYINKVSCFENIVHQIEDLILTKEQQNKDLLLQSKIISELNYLHYNENYMGTKFLLEAITLSINNPNYENINLKRDIYPIIASRHNTTTHNVKCNINNATSMMNCECEKNIIMKYFHFYDTKTEAKAKTVIKTIVEKLKV